MIPEVEQVRHGGDHRQDGLPSVVVVPVAPVGKSVAWTSWSMSQSTMSRAGIEPAAHVEGQGDPPGGPRAVGEDDRRAGDGVGVGPAVGLGVGLGLGDATATAVAVGSTLGAGVGVGGAGLGEGGFSSSTAMPGRMTRTQPSSIEFGS